MRSLTPVLLIVALLACGPPALTNAHTSVEGVARAVLQALARNDATALQALALNESEFKAHVWPSLPVARPERNLPFSYVWGDLRQKSDASLARLLAERGGRRYELLAVTFDDPPREYAAFRVHSKPTFKVRLSDGSLDDLHVTGSILEKDGVWKVFSYVVDD